MIHIHATKKLLNTGRLKGDLLVTRQDDGQLMHNWYATLSPSGFAGKSFVMYMHDPSLLVVLTHGRTIKSTHHEFILRLSWLLERSGFPPEFKNREIMAADEYVVGKTNSRSLLGHMNDMQFNLDHYFLQYEHYDHIDLDRIEDLLMDHIHHGKGHTLYSRPITYWEGMLQIKLKQLRPDE